MRVVRYLPEGREGRGNGTGEEPIGATTTISPALFEFSLKGQFDC